MASFMDNPYMGQYMGQMGLGLLAASQPQPYGVNRYSLIQNSMNQANQNLMRQQMFDMQKEEYEEKKKERNKIKTAQSKLFGGEDPSTDITWETGRQGMSPEETMAAVGQVAPEAAIERMLAKPQAPGKPYLVQEGDKKVYYRDIPDGQGGFKTEKVAEGPAWKPAEKSGVESVTLRNQDTGQYVEMDKKDPRLPGMLGPDSPWVKERIQRTGGLPATRIDDIKADLSSVTRARSRVKQMLTAVTEDRSRAGIAGTIRRWGQTALGITNDLADLGIDVGGIVGDTVVGLKEDLNAENVDPQVATYFDEKLPQNTVFENSLAYQLARARKVGKRINLEDFKTAKADINLTGVTSSDDVIARLRAIDMEFAEAEMDLNKRMGKSSPDEPPSTGLPTYEIRNGKLIKVE